MIINLIFNLFINDFWTNLLLITVISLIVHKLIPKPKVKKSSEEPKVKSPKTCRILYVTQTGTSKRLSIKLQTILTENKILNENKYEITLGSIKDYEPEELFTDSKKESLIILIVSTYAGGGPPPDGEWFCKWLDDTVNDFRVNKNCLNGLGFAIFGVGDKAYGQDFCLTPKNIDHWLKKLNAVPIISTQLSDISHQKFNNSFDVWTQKLLTKLSNNSSEELNELNESDSENSENESKSKENIVDIEDLMANKVNGLADNGRTGVKKDMLTTDLRKELTKQGYKLIGTHSGVKLCRWTKSMLRGRGIGFAFM